MVLISLAVAVPLFTLQVFGATLVVSNAIPDPQPPRFSAADSARIDQEVTERLDLLGQLDTARSDYQTAVSDWTQSKEWADDIHTGNEQATPAVGNPGGGAMPGNDPQGRAFLDSIGATDVSVIFEAGPENCGYYGNGGGNRIYAGGCYTTAYPNTLFMAWDPGAESIVWPIFVHEAMHWYQDENYAQATFLADFAGIPFDNYKEKWEADASCRAVYTYGIPISEYVDTTSPCTIDGWYEGYITDYLSSLGAKLSEPDPATFEVTEASRP